MTGPMLRQRGPHQATREGLSRSRTPPGEAGPKVSANRSIPDSLIGVANVDGQDNGAKGFRELPTSRGVFSRLTKCYHAMDLFFQNSTGAGAGTPGSCRRWMLMAPPASTKVHLTLNFEPSRRLRLYQFDPLHHDVVVFSLH